MGTDRNRVFLSALLYTSAPLHLLRRGLEMVAENDAASGYAHVTPMLLQTASHGLRSLLQNHWPRFVAGAENTPPKVVMRSVILPGPGGRAMEFVIPDGNQPDGPGVDEQDGAGVAESPKRQARRARKAPEPPDPILEFERALATDVRSPLRTYVAAMAGHIDSLAGEINVLRRQIAGQALDPPSTRGQIDRPGGLQ